MCIAAIINHPLSLHHLQCMDRDNPHGGGVAWLDSAGQLQFRRGLDAHQVYALQETALTYPYLLHFRWATHGAPVPELTHPFPTGPRAFRGELEGVADEVLIHNGVWRDYDSWVEWLPSDMPREIIEATSDTAVAAYFYWLIPDLGDEIPWAVASARVGPDGKMKIRKHGGWSEHMGSEFSNLTWLPYNEWPDRGITWGRSRLGGWSWLGDAPASKSVVGNSGDSGDNVDINDDNAWEEYVRTRYGIEVAAAVADATPDSDDDAELMAKMAEAEAIRELEDLLPDEGFCEPSDELPDDDMISDDPDTVNRWLAQRSAVNYLKKGA